MNNFYFSSWNRKRDGPSATADANSIDPYRSSHSFFSITTALTPLINLQQYKLPARPGLLDQSDNPKQNREKDC